MVGNPLLAAGPRLEGHPPKPPSLGGPNGVKQLAGGCPQLRTPTTYCSPLWLASDAPSVRKGRAGGIAGGSISSRGLRLSETVVAHGIAGSPLARGDTEANEALPDSNEARRQCQVRRSSAGLSVPHCLHRPKWSWELAESRRLPRARLGLPDLQGPRRRHVQWRRETVLPTKNDTDDRRGTQLRYDQAPHATRVAGEAARSFAPASPRSAPTDANAFASIPKLRASGRSGP